MALLDTIFLLDVMRGRERAIEALVALEDEGEPLSLAATSLAEFHRGIATVEMSAERRRRVVEVVHGRPLLAFDAAAAERAGRIDAALWARGEPLDPEDAAMAGVALAHDEVLVTRRTKEFGRVEGLRLRSY